MVQYLVDANTISEAIRRRPNENALNWIAAQSTVDLFLSVLTIGELRNGAEMLKRRDSKRAQKISKWIDAIEIDFSNRILPVTTEIATRWGIISADRSRPIVDTLLAATAIEHKLIVATRNSKDFQGLDVKLVNPFEFSGNGHL